MIIKDIELYNLSVRLKKPFKTALRTVNSAEETIVKVVTEEGMVGFGEAPPTAVITGDTNASIRGIIEKKLKPVLIGQDITCLEKILHDIQDAAVGNTSAKAALDMAIYDLYGQLYKAPLYK